MKYTRGFVAALACFFLLCACGPADASAAPSQPAGSAPVSSAASQPKAPDPASLAPFSFPVPDGSEAAVTYRFLCSFAALAGPRYTQLARGLQDHCNILGIELALQDSDGQPEMQAEALHNYVAQQVDGIFCLPAQPEALEVAMQDAEAAGVPVLAIDGTLPGAIHCALQPAHLSGEALGEAAGRWLQQQGGSAQAVLFEVEPDHMEAGLLGGLASGLEALLPDIAITYESTTRLNQDAAVAEAIAAHSEATVFLATDAQIARELAEQLAAAGRTDVFVGGVDTDGTLLPLLDTNAALKAVADPQWYAAGEALADAMLARLDGEVPDFFELPAPQLHTADDI
ncbi:MAG: sugar ABC transporter substrate-binding protein [Oscillospiraceae bacterium]